MSHRTGADLPKNKIFMILAMALLMMSLDATIVATALDAIKQGLDTSINLAGWTITAYSFGFILMLPVSGKLSEIFGRRRVLIGSVVAFSLASLGCGMADNIYVLIVLRALQAAGGAGFTPTATGIIVDHFGTSRDRYVSFFGSIFPIGAMAGPIFGGFFVEYMSWRDVFYVNLPIGVLIFFLAWRYIPHDRPKDKIKKPMDIVGVLLLGAGLLSGMLGINNLSNLQSGSNWLLLVGLMLLSAIFLYLFFHHIRSSKQPFIIPKLIYGPGFGVVNIVNMIFSGSVIGVLALVPLYAVNRYQIGVISSGSLLTAQGIAAFICSLTAVMLLRKTGYRLPLYVGSAVAIFGLLLLAIPPMFGISAYIWLAFAGFLVGAGNGSINPAMRNAGLQLAPESSSMLAALRTLSLQIGQITTVAIITAVLAGQDNMGIILAWAFVILAMIRLCAMLLIKYVPEQRGAW